MEVENLTNRHLMFLSHKPTLSPSRQVRFCSVTLTTISSFCQVNRNHDDKVVSHMSCLSRFEDVLISSSPRGSESYHHATRFQPTRAHGSFPPCNKLQGSEMSWKFLKQDYETPNRRVSERKCFRAETATRRFVILLHFSHIHLHYISQGNCMKYMSC